MCPAPKMPKTATPPPPPQPEQTASPDVFRKQNQASQGYGATLLTGASGIDPKTQNVGYNTLLGR